MMQTGKAVIVATLLAIAGCGGDSAGPPDTNGGGGATATRLELAFARGGAALAGGAQITVGDTVQVTATAFSSSGAPVSGVGIDWTAATGTLVSSEAATGANGARATWVVGTTPGTQSLSASIRNATVQASASLSAVAGPAIRLGLQPGYAIFITGRRQLPVVAVDRFGNPAGSGSANAWISLDPSIATISSAGELTGVAAGSARIVAVQSGRADTIVVPVLNPAAIKQGQIAAGLSFSCRLDRDGRAICWGNGRWGQLGGGAVSCARAQEVACARPPEPVLTDLRFTYIDAGADKVFAIDRNARISMWGRWDGFASRTSAVDCSGMIEQWCFVLPMTYSAGPFAEVDFTGSTLCARAPAGAVHCWYQSFGATGSGIQHEGDYVTGDHTFSTMTSNDLATCALDMGGAPFCWGVARYASSDASTDTCSSTSGNVPCYLRPVAVATALRFTDIAAASGGSHTCALGTDRRAYCWGRNDAGQLGAGTSGEPSRLVQVGGSLEFAVIGAGSYNTCGTTYSGDSYCWGDNVDGQLGIGSVGGSRNTPTRVASNVTFVDFVGNFDHTCGLAADGRTYCWGSNELGQIGIGTARGHLPTPTLVLGQ